MDIDFQCTKCGQCCRDLWLPLSVQEALRWMEDGNAVNVLCEAIPWPSELPASNRQAAFKRERSFSATSGTLAIRVLVTLAAPLGGRCPNLLADNLCGIYERRPVVCRLYPANANPFLEFVPQQRRCPPDAWQVVESPLMRSGEYINGELRLLIRARQERSVEDVPVHEALCKELGIREAAMANEGFVVHAPDTLEMLSALRMAIDRTLSALQDWEFISDSAATVEAIRSCDAECSFASQHLGEFDYLSSSAS
ncbi:YkgJ family cysteine cluster protein [Ralstonia pseudosolanacearum]|nr:YkgJ family cysteine cluster protein [Ralstonia pseudosolanacearum CaRs-Mep]MCQ4682705.1 YkgJ family cysteine cluster protein [Ralstonia pseudosolanacearum]